MQVALGCVGAKIENKVKMCLSSYSSLNMPCSRKKNWGSSYAVKNKEKPLIQNIVNSKVMPILLFT